MPPIIIVGGGSDAAVDGAWQLDPEAEIDVVVLPGESRPTARPGLRIHAPETLEQALLGFRYAYGQHSAITSLAGATVLDAHPVAKEAENTRSEWSKAIQFHLGELFQDIGNSAIDNWEGARNAIHNGGTIEKSPNSGHLAGSLRGKPAICLAAGPSAQAHMAEVRALQGSHAIFACDAMLRGGLNFGITPHFTCGIERVPELARFFDGLGGCGTTLIAPPVLDPSAFAHMGTHAMVWFGVDDLYRWIDPAVDEAMCGRSAGTLSVAAALLAGCNPIYLVGHDLAYKDGRSHTGDFQRVFPDANYNVTSNWEPLSVRFDVPANGGGTVTTSGAWNLFRGDIETLVSMYPEQTVINANHDEGAAIAGVRSGALPTFAGSPLELPSYPASGIKDLRSRIPSIADDITRLEYAARGFSDAIENAESIRDLDLIARGLAVGAIVSPDNAWLFRYSLRTLYHALKMRLNLRQEGGIKAQAAALRVVTRTLPSICAMMRRELPC